MLKFIFEGMKFSRLTETHLDEARLNKARMNSVERSGPRELVEVGQLICIHRPGFRDDSGLPVYCFFLR